MYIEFMLHMHSKHRHSLQIYSPMSVWANTSQDMCTHSVTGKKEAPPVMVLMNPLGSPIWRESFWSDDEISLEKTGVSPILEFMAMGWDPA